MSDTSAYRTLAAEGRSEHVAQRSRFLGWALPATSLEDALAFVDALRTEHYDARHVCYGLRIGRGAQRIDRSNDDGEPARTGGFPLWQLLEGDDLVDSLIVVVRYYGGVKLGMGGLARAYREAGRLAVADAGIVVRHPETYFDLEIPYEMLGKLEHAIEERRGIRVQTTDYGAAVTLHLAAWSESLDDVRRLLGGLLNRDPTSIAEQE
jgi:uncharacterized YigZ family protein